MAIATRARPAASAPAGPAASGLRALALCLGVFLLAQGYGKLTWFTDSGPLDAALQGWLRTATPTSRWYLETVAIPGLPMFARLVPAGELLAGAALVVGFWPRLAAAAALLMVLNFHLASGALFQDRFLSNAYGLPVLGALLAIAVGGARLPWSART